MQNPEPPFATECLAHLAGGVPANGQRCPGAPAPEAESCIRLAGRDHSILLLVPDLFRTEAAPQGSSPRQAQAALVQH